MVGRSYWRMSLVSPRGEVVDAREHANQWLEQGRMVAAGMVFGTSTARWQPYDVVAIGTNGLAASVSDEGCLSEVPLVGRIRANAKELRDGTVSLVAEFDASDFLGLDIVEAALHNSLTTGPAIFRVVYDVPITISVGPGFKLLVALDIDVLAP